MTAEELISLVFVATGGLALFLFGIHIMTGSLRAVAAERLRSVLALATRSRVTGLSLGAALGFLIHSSAASVMTVGLVNAGLVRLAGALPILFGANIGTTLSMQVVSLRLTDLAFGAIAVGVAVHMIAPREGLKQGGRALLGIGILFLGMEIMSGAIEPHRDAMRPWLERIDGTSWTGMFLGIAAAGLFTAVIQSSGATIGMCFVLISAGVFTELEQVYPIVLGAHIGTSATALLASIGVSIEARRAAVGNLIFNLFNTLLALAAAPLFLRLLPLTAESLVHQTANLHTAVMTVAALLLLPFVAAYAAMIEKTIISRKPAVPGTFLDTELIPTPENAIRAAVRELNRCAGICLVSLGNANELLNGVRNGRLRTIRKNEEVVNEIKTAFRTYLTALARRYLSRRQALFTTYLNRIVANLERIGDHIENLGNLAATLQRDNGGMPVDKRIGGPLAGLNDKARDVLAAVEKSLKADGNNFHDDAAAIMRARDAYVEASTALREEIDRKVAAHEIFPTSGLRLSEYIMTSDRMVRHCKLIAIEEQQPFFGFKEKKLGRVADPLDDDQAG